ncbi:MAG TPA: hypothetical protein VM327_08505 [Candidatus Thermoplasmatota archaeon]|nr:hypothetical protein [Candidatus Thermoplasmatota archaeon]
MTRHAAARHLLLCAFLAATLAPAAAAAEGPGAWQAVVFNDPAVQEGRLALALVSDTAEALPDGSAPSGSPVPLLDVTAASAHIVQHRYTSQETALGTLPDDGSPPQRSELDLQDALIQLAGFQPGYEVHIASTGPDLAYHVETDGGELVSVAGPVYMRRGSLGTDLPGSSSGTQDAADFAVVERAGPLLVQQESAPRHRLTVTGDMVVEIEGLTLHARDADSDATLESGVWRTPMAGLPGGSEAAAYEQSHAFLRLVLVGATLELGGDGGAPYVTWAVPRFTGEFTGPVTLEPKGDGLRAAGGRDVVAAGSRLLLVPADDLVSVEVVPGGIGTRGTIADVPAPTSAALIGTGAVLALAIAIGIGVLRRVLRLPALADVETAIEEGEYRRAAKLAARILSRLPGSEEALLGRAIALSKAGRHQDVVSELTRHLALRPASDGTLHYVLGLSQLDSGRADEGQASLREAVRLTPALQPEVAPRLGKAFSAAQPTTREAHGYA